jgi:site-specific DNA-cytosine methylase
MPVDVFTAGPPCVQKSKLNRTPPPENTTCIQTGTGPTGTGFGHVFKYVKTHRPKLVIIENVKLDVGVETKEADFVMTELNAIGYAVKKVVLDARDYGSLVPRSRQYFVCVLEARDVEHQLSFLFNRILGSLIMLPRPPEDFITMDVVELKAMAESLGFDVPLDVAPQQKKDALAKYKDCVLLEMELCSACQ